MKEGMRWFEAMSIPTVRNLYVIIIQTRFE